MDSNFKLQQSAKFLPLVGMTTCCYIERDSLYRRTVTITFSRPILDRHSDFDASPERNSSNYFITPL